MVDINAADLEETRRPVSVADHRKKFGKNSVAFAVFDKSDNIASVPAQKRRRMICPERGLARPHLTNPHFTLEASAWYGHKAQRWPIQYNPAKEQAMGLAQRKKSEAGELRKATAPSSHGNADA